jgi:Uma2 family endonuclease
MANAGASLVQEKKVMYEINPIAWKDFKSRYLRREDSYRYEWVNGMVEKTPRNMNQEQFFILRNLFTYFRQSKSALLGELMTEGDMFFDKNHRRPDVCFLTHDQITRSAYGENQVPDFVIEIISDTDTVKRVNKKMQDYRNANVKVVWQVLPEDKEIHIYHGDNLMQISIIKKDMPCMATPVLENFSITANQLFLKPPKPE